MKEEFPEMMKIREAAVDLRVSERTLENWILHQRFTEADELRKLGGALRFYFPILKARLVKGTLMGGAGKHIRAVA